MAEVSKTVLGSDLSLQHKWHVKCPKCQASEGRYQHLHNFHELLISWYKNYCPIPYVFVHGEMPVLNIPCDFCGRTCAVQKSEIIGWSALCCCSHTSQSKNSIHEFFRRWYRRFALQNIIVYDEDEA